MTLPLVCLGDLPRTDFRSDEVKIIKGRIGKNKKPAEHMRQLMMSNLVELERRTTSLCCRVQNMRQFLARKSPKMYDAACKSAPELFTKLEEIEEAAKWISAALDARVGDPREVERGK